jgi:hypothetical protein
MLRKPAYSCLPNVSTNGGGQILVKKSSDNKHADARQIDHNTSSPLDKTYWTGFGNRQAYSERT